ncbi:MAM (Meprin, A5-protein, PTPmu) domain protein [Ditylenchus destructor]|nr:MAM (Meprin, A5-protein, PTPmu) domain protein [Ditylenchus destructor]
MLKYLLIFRLALTVVCQGNQQQGARWKVSLGDLPSPEVSTPSNFPDRRPNNNIRLVDYREWQLLKGQQQSSSEKGPPMLIVAPEEAQNSNDHKRTSKDRPAEAIENEDEHISKEEDGGVHVEKSVRVPKETISTTTEASSTAANKNEKSPLEITTQSSSTTSSTSSSSSEDSPSTTVTIPPIDLKNLPNLFHLLKQLTIIPTILRSLGGGQGAGGGMGLAPGASSSTNYLMKMLTGNGLGSGLNSMDPPLTSTAVHADSSSNSVSSLLDPNFAQRIETEPPPGSDTKLFSLREFANPSLRQNSNFGADFITNSDEPETRRSPISNAISGTNNQNFGIHLPTPDTNPGPIVPVMTTYDSGKIRKPNPNALNLNSVERFNRLNIYGIDESKAAVNNKKAYEAPALGTTNGSAIHIPTDTQSTKKPRPKFDLSELTVAEVEQLESIHRKLFTTNAEQSSEGTGRPLSDRHMSPNPDPDEIENQPTTPMPLVIYQKAIPNPNKPTQVLQSSGAMNQIATNIRKMPEMSPEMVNDLMAIKELPDLDELTKGLDLSLMNKPGGFAILKQQFIERLIQRSMLQRRSKRR